ncbi:MAG: DUF3347 domain-containing protein, partial [Maribacter sp.]
TGTISFLDPVIDPKTRVAKARIEVANPGLKLKPEMFASGNVEAKLPKQSNAIVVPKTAVMWTGERSVVYVKSQTDKGVNFMMRDVNLGPALGESFVIESGLQGGEEIAVNGTFSIDAAAQLAGKPSMMNPVGGPAMTGHNHGGEAMSQKETDKEPQSFDVSADFKRQLTQVYNKYLIMKDAFIESDAHPVMTAAGELSGAMQNVDMGLLKGEAHIAWMEYLDVMEKTTDNISKLMDIEKQREEFAQFNLAFYKALKSFGLSNTTAYYQYCPMAEKDKAAYWFSATEDIRNPYFGDAMLGCGENRETIK